MHKMKAPVLCLLPALMLLLPGCYYDKEDLLYPGSAVDCSTISAKFTDVAPIIAAKCATAGCHNAATAAGATVLETFDQIRTKVDRINQRTLVEKTMPPGTALTAGETAILKCWISSGTPNN